jgi:cyanophycinase-like exopeptidase
MPYKMAFKLFLAILLLLTTLFACRSGGPDASSPAPVLADPNPVQSWSVGDTADVARTTQPGLVLMGGSTEVDEAMRWLISRAGGGDFVVLRASGSDGYNPYVFSELGGVNSCETFLVNSRDKASNARLLRRVRGAEALFIAGGDQANYVNFWKGTPLAEAINYLINDKKVPVGGTSAGCAILGRAYFAALNGTVNSETALANPMSNLLTIGQDDFINAPFMANTLTDTHYDNPDRRGRHLVFLARLVAGQAAPARGIGVPERTAVLVDELGQARVMGRSPAFFLQAAGPGPETLGPNSPLTWDRSGRAVRVLELGPTDGSYNLATWPTNRPGKWAHWAVRAGMLVVGE